jgi:hypothetical protein
MSSNKSDEPQNLVDLIDLILSRMCRNLKGSKEILYNACTEMESFGINPDKPEPDKVMLLIRYAKRLKDKDGNLVFSEKEIAQYIVYLRKFSGENDED